MIRATITEFADRLDLKSFDAVQDFSALFPVEIITTMLGVPPADRQQVRHWLDRALTREPGDFRTSPDGMAANIESGLYYYELVQKRRAEPQDDMISQLTQVEVEREDGGVAQLTDIEITGFLSLLGGAGAETVTKVVASALVILAERPELWQLLQQDRSLIPAAFEEVLRFEGPVGYLIRYSMREIEPARVHHPETRSGDVGYGCGDSRRTGVSRPRHVRPAAASSAGTTSGSATARTAVSARPWRAWRATSPWNSCSIGCPATRWTAPRCGAST